MVPAAVRSFVPHACGIPRVLQQHYRYSGNISAELPEYCLFFLSAWLENVDHKPTSTGSKKMARDLQQTRGSIALFTHPLTPRPAPLPPAPPPSSSPLHRGVDGPPRPGEVMLIISNLHYEVGLDLLASEFSTCGAVMRCRIINNPDGRSRGVAFVSYGEKSSADRAISKYHDR